MTARGPVACWVDGQREPQCPPNPAYPNGVDLDMAGDAALSCLLNLAYPAPRCGHHRITCTLCGLTAMVTTAGRRDDPISVRLACRNPRRGVAAIVGAESEIAALDSLAKASREVAIADATRNLMHQGEVRSAALRARRDGVPYVPPPSRPY